MTGDSASGSSPRERGAGLAAVVTAATGFSWGFIIVKSLGLPGPAVAFWRLLIGAAFLTACAALFRLGRPRAQWSVVITGLAFGFHQVVYIAATRATSVAIVALVQGSLPLLVALLSRRVVGERVTAGLVLWSALALVGIASVIHANLDDPSRSALGDGLAVLNIAVFAAYFLGAKRARAGGISAVTLTATAYWIALLAVAPLALLAAGPGVAVPAGAEIGLLVLLALGPGNGHFLLNWAHPRVRAALSSLVLAAVPILSALWAHLLLDEPLGWRHGAGFLLVAVAIEGGRRADSRAARRRDALSSSAQ